METDTTYPKTRHSDIRPLLRKLRCPRTTKIPTDLEELPRYIPRPKQDNYQPTQEKRN